MAAAFDQSFKCGKKFAGCIKIESSRSHCSIHFHLVKLEPSLLQFKEFTAFPQTFIRVFEFNQQEFKLLFDYVNFEFFTNLRLKQQLSQKKTIED